jgi:hypothetical protein
VVEWRQLKKVSILVCAYQYYSSGKLTSRIIVWELNFTIPEPTSKVSLSEHEFIPLRQVNGNIWPTKVSHQ